MQGRLLPKYKGRYQAHPLGYWMEEFKIASELKLDLIEWIVDFNDVEQNPLSSEDGVESVRQIVQQTGVRVETVCADYFMEAPLHNVDEAAAASSFKVLQGLIQRCPRLGIQNIVIPCVDQ